MGGITEHQDKYPDAYYSIDADDPAANLARQIRRSEYQLWQLLLPDSDDDFDLTVASIQRLTGKGEGQIDAAIGAHVRIRELPFLRELQELTFRLDHSRLVAIDTVLSKVANAELIAEIDRRLALYLMPTRINQHFPTSGQIRRRINDWIRMLAPTVDVDAEPEPPDPPRLSTFHDDNGRSYLTLDSATDVAVEIEEAIRARAREAGCSEGEALLDLVRGSTTTKIVLNVYRAHDVAGAPAFMFGPGWLSPEVSDALEARATHVRDMDEVAHKVSPAYRTPDDMRAFVTGRDGTCRAPGHNTSAHTAQMDHSIDWAEGGETTPDNLASLCARHHNIKTDGRMYPVRLPGGDIVWLYDDGTWVHTEPEGPLSRKARNWVQTVGQRIANRRDHLKAPEKPEN